MSTPSKTTAKYLTLLARNSRATPGMTTIREGTDIGGWRSSAACIKAGWLVMVTPGTMFRPATFKITAAGLAKATELVAAIA